MAVDHATCACSGPCIVHMRLFLLQALAAANAANPLLQAQYAGLAAAQPAGAPHAAQAAPAQAAQQPPALFVPKAHHHPMKQRLHDFARSQLRSEHTGTSGDPPSAQRPERRYNRNECYRSVHSSLLRVADDLLSGIESGPILCCPHTLDDSPVSDNKPWAQSL